MNWPVSSALGATDPQAWQKERVSSGEGAVVPDGIPVTGPAEIIHVQKVVGAIRRAMRLSAHLAVAMIGGFGLTGNFPGYAAAQTFSFTHIFLPHVFSRYPDS